MRKYIVLWSLCGLCAWAQPLARQAWLGARLQAEPLGGLRVLEVVGGSAQSAKLQAQDVLYRINDQAVNDLPSCVTLISRLHEGDKLRLDIQRAGKPMSISTVAQGRKREHSQKGEVVYDRVPFKGGFLSVIINKPLGKGPFPAVLFIPGYTCSSVDGLSDTHPYGRVVRAFEAAGFVVVRVEKSGLGDSQNTPDCSQTTLTDEVEGFTAGFSKMQSLPYVNPQQCLLFGHSMGGIIAPAISAKANVKGVMVYGTTAKSWFEYQLEMNRLQLKLAHTPGLEYEAKCRIQAEMAYAYFIEKKSLSDMARDPAKAAILRSDWQYDGGNMIFDRNQEYWRQIQDYPLLEHWQKTSAKVLVMFGASDFQAFSKADHQQIVDLVNEYHPNQAQLLTFHNTDHYMAQSGDMQQAFDLFNSGQYQKLFDLFNPEVTQKAVAWALQCIQNP